MTRVRTWLTSAALILGSQALMAGNAWAHQPAISASASCVQGIATIEYTASEPNGYGHPKIDISFNGVYITSGVFVFPIASFTGSAPAPAGTVTVMAYADGPWSEPSSVPGGQSASTTVEVPSDCAPPPPDPTGTGRFTGGGKQIDLNGISITKGLTIHCDLKLSNNLEINWNQHKFHMLDHFVTLECSDNPLIDQRPPVAPLDTMVGKGYGKYDGQEGYTVEFKLVDAGEPGRLDQAALKIYETANPGNVVLNLPLTYMNTGNLQAHYDQPHK